ASSPRTLFNLMGVSAACFANHLRVTSLSITNGGRYLQFHPAGSAAATQRPHQVDKLEEMSPEQSTPRKSPSQIPGDMNAFNRTVIDDFRANRGQLTGPLAGHTLM